MTPIAASRVQVMAGIFHPFVSLCFHCIFVPGHIASCLNTYLFLTHSILTLEFGQETLQFYAYLPEK